jgi:hypothetical protein
MAGSRATHVNDNATGTELPVARRFLPPQPGTMPHLAPAGAEESLRFGPDQRSVRRSLAHARLRLVPRLDNGSPPLLGLSPRARTRRL